MINFKNFSIQEGRPEHIKDLLQLIKELALYEKAPEQVTNTESKINEDAFGQKPIFKFWMVYEGRKPVAMMVVYFRYSTWKGKTLYLEDLYIQEAYRQRGLGQILFEVLISYAKKEQCQRISWQVLDWNEPAIAFYKKIGASLSNEWLNGFLEL
ncbi:MAG: GNAT family N-acetyltransferase [Thermonemataceae bacterium]|nr:GNAT family N-acetyltransferase [Thermonemataceae bacterium]